MKQWRILVVLGVLTTVPGCNGCHKDGPAPAGQAAPAVESGQPAAPAEAAAADDAEPGLEDDCMVIADVTTDYGPPPLKVRFSAEIECTHSGTPKVTWDFGDGTPVSNEMNPRHVYEKPGDFTATVTVTLGSVTSFDELEITVDPEAEPDDEADEEEEEEGDS